MNWIKLGQTYFNSESAIHLIFWWFSAFLLRQVVKQIAATPYNTILATIMATLAIFSIIFSRFENLMKKRWLSPSVFSIIYWVFFEAT